MSIVILRGVDETSLFFVDVVFICFIQFGVFIVSDQAGSGERWLSDPDRTTCLWRHRSFRQTRLCRGYPGCSRSTRT